MGFRVSGLGFQLTGVLGFKLSVCGPPLGGSCEDAASKVITEDGQS